MDIIKEIIAADREAGRIYHKYSEEKESLPERVQEFKAKADAKFKSATEQKIKELNETAANETNKKIAEIKKNSQKELEKSEEDFKARKKNRVNEVFEKII